MNVNKNHGPLSQHYLDRFKQVVENAMKDHTRVMAFRVDLRLPDGDQHTGEDSAVITRFFESLKAQIRAHQMANKKKGIRVYRCRLRYAWVREFGSEKKKKHYHVVIIINKDAYGWPGDINSHLKNKRGVILLMVFRAWRRAVKKNNKINDKDKKEGKSLVYMPAIYYYLNANDGHHKKTYDALMYHISYMAKLKTKNTDDGERNFGCSQG
ncbi:inovirus Gp2 family protein [Pectobacterium parmentieri]|nr:inovirus Gp2 family protein [Pectobacterium parmentieri]